MSCIPTLTSCNRKFIFFKRVPSVSTGGLSPILFKKLGEAYKRPLYFELSERVPDSLSVSACSEIFSPTYLNDPSRKNFSGPRDRANVKEKCNKSCPTRSHSFPQLYICDAQKAPRILTKLMKIPISLLRKLYVQLIIFLDDILLIASWKEELRIQDWSIMNIVRK